MLIFISLLIVTITFLVVVFYPLFYLKQEKYFIDEQIVNKTNNNFLIRKAEVEKDFEQAKINHQEYTELIKSFRATKK